MIDYLYNRCYFGGRKKERKKERKRSITAKLKLGGML